MLNFKQWKWCMFIKFMGKQGFKTRYGHWATAWELTSSICDSRSDVSWPCLINVPILSYSPALAKGQSPLQHQGLSQGMLQDVFETLFNTLFNRRIKQNGHYQHYKQHGPSFQRQLLQALPGDGRHGISDLGRYKWQLLLCLMLPILWPYPARTTRFINYQEHISL